MDRVYASGASASPPVAPESPSAGYPTSGNPGSATPPTTPGAYWYHMVMEELMAIVEAAGISPAPGDLNQIKQALDAMYMPADAGVGAAARGAFSNLVLSANGVNASVQIAVDQIVVANADDAFKTLNDVSLTVNAAASGANGLDAGVLAGSTWYSAWIIAKDDDTVAGLLSLSSTTPTMPAGYTFKARVGWIRTDATANKYPLAFKQQGRQVAYVVAAGTNVPVSRVMASGAIGSYPTTYAAVSVSPFVPPTASVIDLSAMGITNTVFGIAPSNSFGSPGGFTNPPPIAVNTFSGGKFSMALESSNIYAICSASFHMTCNGWEDNL